ncbi:MAG TPA: AAA family ATPase, partial [Pseudomonadales bacterium]
RLEEYVVELVAASRNPGNYDPDLQRLVRFGASPRGTIALEHCARAHAWLNNQDYVSPENIHAVAPDVLRHRIIMSYEAIADGISVDDFISTLLKLVPVP